MCHVHVRHVAAAALLRSRSERSMALIPHLTHDRLAACDCVGEAAAVQALFAATGESRCGIDQIAG